MTDGKCLYCNMTWMVQWGTNFKVFNEIVHSERQNHSGVEDDWETKETIDDILIKGKYEYDFKYCLVFLTELTVINIFPVEAMYLRFISTFKQFRFRRMNNLITGNFQSFRTNLRLHLVWCNKYICTKHSIYKM